MVEMELLDVRVEPPTNVPVVLLRDPASGRVLPIYIGGAEAQSIVLAMKRYETPRPMTHDLFKNVLDELAVAVERVVVTELRDKTFYAELHLVQGERRTTVSARPSDAIALAVRCAVPIFADDGVLEVAAFDPAAEGEAAEADDGVLSEFRKFIEQVKPEDFV